MRALQGQQAREGLGERLEKGAIAIGLTWCPGAESNHRHEDFQSYLSGLPFTYTETPFLLIRLNVPCFKPILCPKLFAVI